MFAEYAEDTEGMRYLVVPRSGGKWEAQPLRKYDPQVERLVWKNFSEEWKAFT